MHAHFHAAFPFFSPLSHAVPLTSSTKSYRSISRKELSMRRGTVATVLGLLVLAFVYPARAEDKAPKKPLGAWTKSSGDQKITFEFKPDAMLVTIAVGNATITPDPNYALPKDPRTSA